MKDHAVDHDTHSPIPEHRNKQPLCHVGDVPIPVGYTALYPGHAGSGTQYHRQEEICP
jgi:hypothetical protein